MGFVHVYRYAKAKKAPEHAGVSVLSENEVVYHGFRYDLRQQKKTKKFAGFYPSGDGRFLFFDGTDLKLQHADGSVVLLSVSQRIGEPYVVYVGNELVLSVDQREPFVVLDTRTGARVGSLEDQEKIENFTFQLYNPHMPQRNDGETLWLGETKRLARYHIKSCKCVSFITAPEGECFVSIALLASGAVATLLRPQEQAKQLERTHDRIVVYESDGRERWRTTLAPMHMAAVGNALVVVDDEKKAFVVFDEQGTQTAVVPMFEPSKRAWAKILPLPSGREWISVGGHGEWDHYADEALRP